MTTKIPVELSSTPGITDSSNATAITIDSSENVGIGITSPSYVLDVAGSSGTISRIASGGSATYLAIGNTSNTSYIGNNGSALEFYYSGTRAGQWDVDGIKFNNDTAAANGLDDYEEGIHVATITCGTSGTVSLNGAYSDLSYTKIGRLVTVTGFLIVSSVSSPVGYYSISLPFTSANLTDRAGDSNASIHQHYGNNVKPSDMIAFLPESSSQLQVYRGDVGVTRSETSAEDLRASTQIVISVTYTVA